MAKVVLYSLETVGKNMAGPGIRYWEFARTLSKKHEVVLAIPNVLDMPKADHFKVTFHRDPLLKKEMRQADVWISQRFSLRHAMMALNGGVKCVLDAYDPLPLETLEIFKGRPLHTQKPQQARVVDQTLLSFAASDGIICASEKQRDLWLGTLMGMQRLSPFQYAEDPSLRSLIDVVPFGLPSQSPKKTGPGIREKLGLMPSDRVIVWGGGIWNWFDPLSLIKAVHLLKLRRSDIKLVFMGVKPPSETVPDMEMSRQAMALAERLQLVGNTVFFNDGWVPYHERQNILLEADIGASIHLEHLETRFSFRTRMLDYLWCELPILATEGDSFADWIRMHQLGKVVPYCQPEAIAEAICAIVDSSETRHTMKHNIREWKASFAWEEIVQPLDSMIQRLSSQPKHFSLALSKRWKLCKIYASIIENIRKEKGIHRMAAYLASSLVKRAK